MHTHTHPKYTDDPTPALSSPAATATAAGATSTTTALAGGSETPSTARVIRLLQFPPSAGGGAGRATGAGAAVPGSGSATRKAVGRTPLGGAGGAVDESMTYNYPGAFVYV